MLTCVTSGLLSALLSSKQQALNGSFVAELLSDDDPDALLERRCLSVYAHSNSCYISLSIPLVISVLSVLPLLFTSTPLSHLCVCGSKTRLRRVPLQNISLELLERKSNGTPEEVYELTELCELHQIDFFIW